jgi:hypothetical protein
MRMMNTVVFVKLVFLRVEGFKIEQTVAIKFCVQIRKTATETFGILKSPCGEDSLSRTSLNGIKVSKNDNAKIADENNVDCTFKLKVLFITNKCRKIQL